MVVSTADFITWAISCVSSSSSLLLFRIYPFWPSHSAYRSKWADRNSKPLKEYRDDAKHTWKHWNNILCINSIVMTRATQKYTIAFGPCLINANIAVPSDRSNEHIVFGQRSLPIPSVAVCVCCTIKIVLFITLLSAKDHIVPENHTAEQCV